MLVCNETVAERFFGLKLHFYIGHMKSLHLKKIASFSKLIHNFWIYFKGTKMKFILRNFQLLTREVKGKKEETLINTPYVKISLKKAIYSSEPGIHFGLAAQYYSHFTAPIRRYPDLVIHRIIKSYLHGKTEPSSSSKT